MLKVYHLEYRAYDGRYDFNYAMAVVAEDEDEARLIASENDGNNDAWLHVEYVEVTEFKGKGAVLVASTGG